MTMKVKLVSGIATGALLLGAFAPAAFADTCTISGNGAFSHNKCKVVTVTKTGGTKQVNVADFSNHVSVHTSSGGNNASGNVGGDVTVTSGDSTVTVTITNAANLNVINP